MFVCSGPPHIRLVTMLPGSEQKAADSPVKEFITHRSHLSSFYMRPVADREKEDLENSF